MGIWNDEKVSPSRIYSWFKHERAQASHIFDMEKSHSFQLVYFKERIGEYNDQIETTYLKKTNHDCKEDNSMLFKDCINEFIMEKIGCHLPWLSQMSKTLPMCKSNSELQSFRNISLHLTSQAVKNEIEREGCFVPNCKRTKWIKNQYTEKSPEGMNFTKIYLYIPSTAKVLERKEILLANTSTFVADIGSYLGLFLGGSILLLVDLINDSSQSLYRRLYK